MSVDSLLGRTFAFHFGGTLEIYLMLEPKVTLKMEISCHPNASSQDNVQAAFPSELQRSWKGGFQTHI